MIVKLFARGDLMTDDQVLYTYLCRHLDLRIKQKTRDDTEYLMGRTIAKKYETIAQEC